MKKRFLFVICLSMIVLALCNGCGNKEEKEARDKAASAVENMR